MTEIDLGEITIEGMGWGQIESMDGITVVRKPVNEIRVEFRFWNDKGIGGKAKFSLMLEYHPELEAHCEAIRLYMKQQARGLLDG